MAISKKMHFSVIIEQDEDNVFIVTCPQLPGCHSYGKTIEEAMNNIREAIELCLEDTNEKPINHFIGVRDLEIMIPAKA